MEKFYGCWPLNRVDVVTLPPPVPFTMKLAKEDESSLNGARTFDVTDDFQKL